LNQAELNEVTAGVLRIGGPGAGTINVSAAITNPATWNTLTLINNGSITESAAGSLILPNLSVSSAGPVTLTSANNVGVLAADTTGSFSFSNGTNSLSVGVVDADTGIITSNSDVSLTADNLDLQQAINAGTGIVMLQPFTSTLAITLGTGSIFGTSFGLTDAQLGQVSAGVLRIGNTGTTGGISIAGTITRHAGFATLDLITGAGVSQTAALSVANLAVQAGSQMAADITLTDTGNDVDRFAASNAASGSNIFYTDTNGFTVGTVDGVAGIATVTGSGETVTLAAGGTVGQDSGAGVVSDNLLLLDTGAGASYALNAAANDVGTLAASVINTVSYTDANDLTIGTVAGVFGVTSASADVNISSIAGDLTVSQNVAAATTVSLTAGSTIASPDHILTNNASINAASSVTLAADRMALDAGTIVTNTGGSNVVQLQTASSGRSLNIDDTAGDPSGELRLSNAELDTITTDIVRVGDLSITGNVTIKSAVTAPAGWNTLSLLTSIGGSISQIPGASIIVPNLQAAGAQGVTLVDPGNSVTQLAGASLAHFDFLNSTALTIASVDAGLGSGFGNGIITSGPVGLTVNAPGASLTVNQAIDTRHFSGAGSNIRLTADNMTLNAGLNAGPAIVTLGPLTVSDTISIGGAAGLSTLGLSDSDLSQVTAGAVRIGGSGQTGAISIDGAITRHAGYNTLDLIAIGPSGAIVGNGGSLDVANLALQADSGIGSAAAIQVVGPIDVAFADATAGNVQINSTGALTIAAVDGVISSTDVAAGETVTLTANSPVTFAVNTTTSGTLTATTTETAGETTTPLPPPDDDITVNSGVTVESTGGDVVFTSGDGITLQSGSLVKSDTGTVALTAGMGDNDNDAALNLSGTISTAANFNLTSSGDICVGNIDAPGQTVTITSTNGAILDCSDSPDATDIIAATVNLQAATGIGVRGTGVSSGDEALEIQAGTLSFSNSTSGNVQIINVSGDLLASGSNSAPGGTISLTAQNGGTLTVAAGGLTTANGDITLSADAMTLTGPVNAGTGTVTLEQAGTAARNIDLGGGTTTGDLNLSDATLALVTGGILRIGRANNPGSITITAPVTTHAGFSTLSLLTGAGVSETGTGAISVTSLAVQAADAINLATNASAASNLAANDSAGGLTLLDSLPLTVATVDGINGITASGDILLEASIANTALTVSQPVAFTSGNVQFAFDNMTLAAAVSALHTVTLLPFSAGQAIDIGGPDALGTLGLDAGEIDQVHAQKLQIGDANSGQISIDSGASIDAANVTDLGITTGGNNSITFSGSSQILKQGNVSGTLTLTTNPAGTGGIINNNPPLILTVGNFANLVLTAGSGGIGAIQPLVTRVGTLTATSVNADIQIQESDDLQILLVNAGTGNFKLLAPGFTGIASINLAGNITASTVTIDLTLANPANTASVTQTAGVITAGNLLLLGTNGSPATTAALNQTGNQIATVAANLGGSLSLQDAAALTVGSVSGTNGIITGNADVTLTAPSLTLAQPIQAGSGAVILTAANGAITGAGGAAPDITAGTLALVALSGIGTSATPLQTAVGDLAASGGSGGVFVVNSTPLTIGTVTTLSGVLATGGNIALTAPTLTIATNIVATGITPSAGNVSLQADGAVIINAGVYIQAPGAVAIAVGVDADNDGGSFTLQGQVKGATVTIQGSPGNDTFTINTTGSSPLAVNGAAGADTFNITPSTTTPITLDGGPPATAPGDVLNFDASGLGVRIVPNVFTASGRQSVHFSNIEGTHVNNAAAINSFYGPDTADRGALAGLTAQERFVEVLYLNALGRVGQRSELDVWVALMNSPGGSQAAVAQGIEQSAEARDHLVKTWYRNFLGRAAAGGEELPWVNMLGQGASEETVLSDILGSQEFFNRAQTLITTGTPNERFVQSLYLVLLNRTASNAEVAFWVNQLPALGRAGVARSFLGSNEYRADLIAAYYYTLLHRPADAAGMNAWLNSGMNARGIREGFDSSGEFFTNG
jgi:hypothetical protein